MFAMIAPGILLFSVFFGVVGLFVGMGPFVTGGAVGLAVSLVGLVLGYLKARRNAALDALGVAVQAAYSKRERARTVIWGELPVRIVCIGQWPELYRGREFRSDWFVDRRGAVEEMPRQLTVMVSPDRPARYHVDLRPFAVRRHFGWRALWMPAAIMAVALVATVFTTLSVGEGPQALRPPSAAGAVQAKGRLLGQWSFQASACKSGAPQGFSGVSVFDADKPDQQLTLIRDKVQGDILDADIPGQDKDLRFLPHACSMLKAELRPMDSVVNHVTNLEGRLDAECQANGEQLSAHVTFQLCH
jgi:hypothetical protein